MFSYRPTARNSYSPELNPVERFWEDLKDKIAHEQIAWSLHEHLSDLRQRMRERLSAYMRERLSAYVDEAVASITGYRYLSNAASALSI